MRVSVIGDFDTVTGFKLAGVKDTKEVGDPKDAIPILKKEIKKEDIGVIIITERIAEEIRDEMKAFTEDLVMPIIVEIPDKKGPMEAKIDPIKEMVRRAVGVEIKTE
jgi:V/A-type H+-transporting ATPase subunit F